MVSGDLKTKSISVTDLRPGMYVLELDQPWIKTPFFRHRFLVQNAEQINTLKQAAVRQVVIDPSRGLDVVGPLPASLPKAAAPLKRNPAAPENTPAVGPQEAAAVVTQTSREAVRNARAIRDDALSSIRTLFAGTKTGIPLETPALQGIVRGLMINLLEHPAATAVMMHLERMQKSHRCVFEHAVDVSVISMLIGRAQRLPPHELSHLGLGALMHDLGEMELPAYLQRPSGVFNEQAEALFRDHPRQGSTILSRTKGVPEPVHRIVWEHHERVDGSGYPYGLQGAQISILSQIVGLADTYDGMLTRRDGHPQLSGTEAFRQLYQLGTERKFDQSLVERMIQCFGVYPVGSLVTLNTGEQGWVIAENSENRLQPWVKLVWDRHGAVRYIPELVDLSSPKPGESERTIADVLNPSQEGVDGYSILAC